MELRNVDAREHWHYGERLAGIDRTEHDIDLLSARELGGPVHGFGWIALRIAADQFDLAAIDAAGRIDFLHGHLDAAIDPDASG